MSLFLWPFPNAKVPFDKSVVYISVIQSNFYLNPDPGSYSCLCGFRSRRGRSVSSRRLWTSAPAPSPSTASQPPTSSTCCSASRTWARLCCTAPGSRASRSRLPPRHPPSPLRGPSWSSTRWLVRSRRVASIDPRAGFDGNENG